MMDRFTEMSVSNLVIKLVILFKVHRHKLIPIKGQTCRGKSFAKTGKSKWQVTQNIYRGKLKDCTQSTITRQPAEKSRFIVCIWQVYLSCNVLWNQCFDFGVVYTTHTFHLKYYGELYCLDDNETIPAYGIEIIAVDFFYYGQEYPDTLIFEYDIYYKYTMDL